jgi:hypothetical protein
VSKLDILNPVVNATVAGEKVAVREMAWRDSLEFLSMLSEHGTKMVSEEGKFAFNLKRLGELIQSSEELANFLILKSTGRDAEWLNALPFREGLELLDAAISINLSPEMFATGKKVEGRLRSLFGSVSANSTNGSAQ